MKNLKYGIWYKNLGKEGQYIAPYKGITDIFAWKYDSEFIENEKFRIDDSSKNLTNCYKEAIPCLLSEIDRILPFDHPDRTSGVYFQLENIPEKWFVKIASDSKTAWIKYSKNNVICGQGKTVILEDRSNFHQEITVNQFLYLMAEKNELVSDSLNKLSKGDKILIPEDSLFKLYDIFGKPFIHSRQIPKGTILIVDNIFNSVVSFTNCIYNCLQYTDIYKFKVDTANYDKDLPIGIHENVSFKSNNFTLINKYNSINF